MSPALERAAKAQQKAERRTRAAVAALSDDALRSAAAVDVLPVLADGRGSDVIASSRALAITQRTIDRIDWFVLLVAIVVATVLGVTVLWTPNPTWGGWDDRIVAVLWGLGLHQFTFTGLAGLADRLRGAQSAGGQP
jgi:hypothetical protein